MWEDVAVVRKCDSPKEVCQFVGRCKGVWRGVTAVCTLRDDLHLL